MLATYCYRSTAVKASTPAQSAAILKFYYAATVIFLLLDYGAGLNIRLAFLEAWPLGRAVYYGICLGCLMLMLWRPGWTVLISAFESIVTLSALIISMGMRTLLVSDAVLESGAGPVTLSETLNFLMSGGIAYLAWVRGIGELRQQIDR